MLYTDTQIMALLTMKYLTWYNNTIKLMVNNLFTQNKLFKTDNE